MLGLVFFFDVELDLIASHVLGRGWSGVVVASASASVTWKYSKKHGLKRTSRHAVFALLTP